MGLLRDIFIIAVLTIVPLFELRLSIPFGILILGQSVWVVLLVASLVNLFDAVIGFWLWKGIFSLASRIQFIEKMRKKHLVKTQKKMKPYVDKYGIFGLAIFIGIPLPGTGAYTAAVGADFLNISFKDFMKAALIGVLIGVTIITLVTLVFDQFLYLLGVDDAKIELARNFIGLD